jgi:hypothetical protein
MESNITDQQYFAGALPLAEPHFEEEATLLSARPVVPLQVIKAKERSGKLLAFGVAMACSLIVGALGTTLVYKQRGEQQAAAVINTAAPGAGVLAVDEPVPAATTAEIVGGAAAGTMPPAGAAVVDKKSVPSVSRNPKSTRVEIKRTTPVPQVDEKEVRRSERIEARRFRRRSEREDQEEYRGHKSRRSDDLLRIREIFEGPSRH